MATTAHHHTDAAEEYARAVVAGDIPACKTTIAACKRHLDDLARSKSADFRYKFDRAKADRICKFVELLPHTKGKWAVGAAGRPGSNKIKLEPWQKFILCTIFGWIHKASGLRRFRQAYICVPRKNGKSALAAGVALYMLAADGEYGAEVYTGAVTERQAWEVFRPAKLMVERTKDFRDHFGVGTGAESLYILGNGSRMEPVAGKPGDGASPSCAIVDEYHEHATDELYDTMLTGMGAREQPLMLIITTAGSDIAGPCYALQQDVEKVLTGVIENDELFGIVYSIDEGDDWTSEIALRKANPNFGVSVGADYLRQRIKDAKQSSRKQNITKTKHLNIWVNARAAFFNIEAWSRAADKSLSLEQFEGEACRAGLDMASKIDITAYLKMFKRQIDGVDHYYVFGRYYLPEEAVNDPAKSHYHGWAHDGHLIATEGNIIDERVIEADILDDLTRFRIEDIGYDPWGATPLSLRLQGDHGATVTEIPQNVANLSEPMKWLEALILAGRVHHDGSPVLTWMLSNVTAKEGANESVYPRKEKRENKIDGAVAMIMALARWMADDGQPAPATPQIIIL